jgi:DNA-binding CsgD family transcriptional regulator
MSQASWGHGGRLVGRDDDMARARSLLDRYSVLVISGASGVGKTSLAAWLAGEWQDARGEVVEIRGTYGLRSVPFGAIAAHLRLDPIEHTTELAARAVQSIRRLGPEVMVLVDDAHLLDEESAGLVSALAQISEVSLVCVVSPGEPAPADITGLWARWPESRIDLGPLTSDQVRQMIVDRLGGEPSDEVVEETSRLTLGYPLYVAALLSEVADQEGVSEGADALRLALSSSDRLPELMERRLSRLDSRERHLFDSIAFAESLPVELARSLSGSDSLSALESAGLITAHSGRIQISHPLLATTSRRSLSRERLRSCANDLLDAITSRLNEVDVASLVRKALDVGVVPPSGQLTTSAQVALAWHDYSGAARLASYAPDDPGLSVLRAKAFRYLGEIPKDIPASLDDAELTDFVSAQSQAMAYGERRFSDAVAVLEEGLATIDDVSSRNRLALELMILAGLSGKIDSLLEASRLVTDDVDPNTQLLAISSTQLSEGLTLSTSTAEETYARGRRVAELGEVDPMVLEQLEISRGLVDLAEARLDEARGRLTGGAADRVLAGTWLLVQSVLADAWLPMQKALDLAEQSVALLESFDPLGNLAQARYVSQLRRAQSRLERGDVLTGPELEPGVAAIDHLMSERADAWHLWAEADPSAPKRLAEIGRAAVNLGHRFWGLCALIDATRLGAGPDVAADIEQLAITRGAGLAVVAGRFARADGREALWDTSRLWLEAGAPVYALEAAAMAADGANAVDCARVQLLGASGLRSVAVDTSGLSQPLTVRQLDTLNWAATGASNDEIAEALFVSRRTIENHLHRIYKMLGVGRDELVELFGWTARPVEIS